MEYLNIALDNWRVIAGILVMVCSIVIVSRVNTGHSINEFTGKRRF